VTERRIATGRCRLAGRRGQHGVTYLVVLFLVALVGMGLAALGTVWTIDTQREKERELLFIGEQFGVALHRYYEASPAIKAYPRRLEDLLEDRRHLVPRRYLRQIFADPVTGQRDWVVVMVGDQIVAVHSRSQAMPIVRNGFPPEWEAYANAHAHAEWIFSPLVPRIGPVVSSAVREFQGSQPATDEGIAQPAALPVSAPRAVMKQLSQ